MLDAARQGPLKGPLRAAKFKTTVHRYRGRRSQEGIVMEVSAELRWFWVNDVPLGLKDWFIQLSLHPFPLGSKEYRKDVYLYDSDQVELGIKARDKKPGL